MNGVRERMRSEGIKCLYCGYKMEKANRPEFYDQTGLYEFVCSMCRFVAYFVGDGNKELNYHGVRMR